MVNPLFNCDEELVKIMNYAFSEDEYNFTIMLDNSNSIEISKIINEDKHQLSINSFDKHIEVTAVHCHDYDGYHANRINMSFGKSSNGKILKMFTLNYFFNHYASKHSFEKIGLSSFRSNLRKVYFSSPNGKITTNISFNEYNNEFRFCPNFIEDYNNHNLYSNDGEEIILLSRYDKDRPENRVIPAKEQIGKLNDSMSRISEASDLKKVISKSYPQYDTESLYEKLFSFVEEYQKHYKDLYDNRLKEVQEAIRNRNFMLEARKDAPFFSKEELTDIIDYLNNYNKNDIKTFQKKKHM